MMNGPRTLACVTLSLAFASLAISCSNELDGSETRAACKAYAQAANTCWQAATGESPIDSAICDGINADVDTCEPYQSGFEQATDRTLTQVYDCYTKAFTKHHEDGLCTSAESAGSVDVDKCPYECPCDAGARKCVDGEVHVCSIDGSFRSELTCPDQTTCKSGYCVSNEPAEPCTPTSFEDALCDGVDEDCDGETDEGFVSEATTCGVGKCAGTGQTSCVDQALVDDCVEEAPATAVDVICDGQDDDCDGEVDEDFVGGDVSCGEGDCLFEGTTTCDDGVESTCTPLDPDCGDAVCGDDGCGGSCGDCPDGQSCNAGVCE